MIGSTLSIAALATASFVAGLPHSGNPSQALKPKEKRELLQYNANVTVHESCNATQSAWINNALEEMYTLVDFGKQYVLTQGPDDPNGIYQRYFGNDSDWITVVGAFDSFLHGNKADGVLMRCDDPDNKCSIQGYNGYYRGNNATSENNICELSYTARLPLSAMCQDGRTNYNASASLYYANDLVHRLYHVPVISDSAVDHVENGDGVFNVLALAQTNSSMTPFNTHSLQYFLLDAWAFEVAAPGVGCNGEVPEPEEAAHAATSTAADAVGGASATATASAAQDCHTHADGTLHCVPI